MVIIYISSKKKKPLIKIEQKQPENQKPKKSWIGSDEREKDEKKRKLFEKVKNTC